MTEANRSKTWCAREGCGSYVSIKKKADGENHCSQVCEWLAGVLDYYEHTEDVHPNLWAAAVTLGDALTDFRLEQQRDQRRRNRRKRRSAARVE